MFVCDRTRPSPPPHPNRQPPQKREISPSGDRPRGSLIPGNHGRLLKIQLPPISPTCHTPHVFRRRGSFYVRSDLPAISSLLLLLPITTLKSQSSSTPHRHRHSPRMISSTSSLLQLKCPRGNKKHLISPRYLGTEQKQLHTYSPYKNDIFSGGGEANWGCATWRRAAELDGLGGGW